MSSLSDLHGTPPPAVLAQRARVAAIRGGTLVAPKPGPVMTSGPVSEPSSLQRTQPESLPVVAGRGQMCALQFDAPLEFVQIEFLATEVSVDDTSITVLFRSDFRLHLGELKPRLRLKIGEQPAHAVAYLGGAFQIPSMGLRGMTFVRILPEE